ncbi:hypothetical protein [Patulibacter defluvii]|uniref:hypothetical protein n=1 Tax=Patulibacter defluvii TaxID=3095358 RepID=UPI0040557974
MTVADGAATNPDGSFRFAPPEGSYDAADAREREGAGVQPRQHAGGVEHRAEAAVLVLGGGQVVAGAGAEGGEGRRRDAGRAQRLHRPGRRDRVGPAAAVAVAAVLARGAAQEQLAVVGVAVARVAGRQRLHRQRGLRRARGAAGGRAPAATLPGLVGGGPEPGRGALAGVGGGGVVGQGEQREGGRVDPRGAAGAGAEAAVGGLPLPQQPAGALGDRRVAAAGGSEHQQQPRQVAAVVEPAAGGQQVVERGPSATRLVGGVDPDGGQGQADPGAEGRVALPAGPGGEAAVALLGVLQPPDGAVDRSRPGGLRGARSER